MALTLDDLARVLRAAPGVDAWTAVETRARSTERFTVFARDEALRQVDDARFTVTVHVHQPAPAGSTTATLGESSFTVGPHVDARALDTAVAAAVERARLAHNRFHRPAGPSAPPPPVQNVDPRVVEDAPAVVDGLVDRLRAAVASHPGVELSSSEVFAAYEHQRILNSAGLDVTRASTDVLMEYVLLARAPGADEVEIYQSPRSRLADRLDLAADVARYVRYTRDGLAAVAPPGGTFDVLLAEEALDSIFDFFVAQSQASALFEGWSTFKPGQPVIPDLRGDALTLVSDPTLPGGARTQAVDAHGTPCTRTVLVQDNVFRAYVATHKDAQLTGQPVTGPMGNVVVAPGNTPLAELRRGPRPVLELLRFSALVPNAISGAFSGEIRTGYLHDNGAVQPIKGGALAGRVVDAFRDARFSAETTTRQAYQGPAGVLLRGLAISSG